MNAARMGHATPTSQPELMVWQWHQAGSRRRELRVTQPRQPEAAEALVSRTLGVRVEPQMTARVKKTT
jgi:hypothetical protein